RAPSGCAIEIALTKGRLGQIGAFQTRSAQRARSESDAAEVGAIESGTGQIEFHTRLAGEIGTAQIGAAKVSPSAERIEFHLHILLCLLYDTSEIAPLLWCAPLDRSLQLRQGSAQALCTLAFRCRPLPQLCGQILSSLFDARRPLG